MLNCSTARLVASSVVALALAWLVPEPLEAGPGSPRTQGARSSLIELDAADRGIDLWVDRATRRVIAAMPEGKRHRAARSRLVEPARAQAVSSSPGAFLIDFDTLPDSSPLAEGSGLTGQYAAFGVIFGGTGVTDDVTGNASFFPGVSLPNYVTFGGYSPGPGAALGCIVNFNGSFTTPASAVSLDAFALTLSNSGTLQLTARDGGGNVVDTDLFVVTGQSFPTLDAFSLTVSAPPAIASIQLTGSNVCASIDNLMFATTILVEIDIKPGSDPNAVNPRSKGKIPVAILTTSLADGDPIDFDAWTVDASTLAFGPNGAGIAHAQGHAEDVDGDGDLDMVVHFKTQQTGIACGDTDATLTGQTLGSQAIEGTDSIKTSGC